jgi:hypothetical protein
MGEGGLLIYQLIEENKKPPNTSIVLSQKGGKTRQWPPNKTYNTNTIALKIQNFKQLTSYKITT